MVNTSSQLSAQAMVDWSRRPIAATEQEGDDMVLHMQAKPELKPRVSFSKVSTLFVYETKEETPKSYSKRDQAFFGVEALREVLRVKELIAQSPPESTKESLRFLLKNRSLAIEEMVGIENAILGQGTHTIIKKHHAKTVLQEQRKQWEQRQNPEDAAENMASVARQSSLKSLLRARACAVFAAQK